ncbi:glycoside hydrolase family 47 protein [Parathielavia appendiculata]|uniref:alpha-1,2-Mannosidase n=1 Tax=Parathielavia appendiculata TaxID=2587402 RepID=A0AAN6YYE7_9PEZI|nr:glycoside hydrolase family 47 protein [Parathielavia appendiculata]
MAIFGRRKAWAVLFGATVFFLFYSFPRLDVRRPAQPNPGAPGRSHHAASGALPGRSTFWSRMKPRYPVTDMRELFTGKPLALPKVQKDFASESDSDRELRLKRRDAVKASFLRSWRSYRKLAWMSDELTPVSGGKHDPFGGWAATLVDSLDTLWIMGLKDEFYDAVAAASQINFDKVPVQDVNIFETNIRYLGGFLAAYDLSGDKRLLDKAREVGELLYVAFDTPNRMPVTRWDAWGTSSGKELLAHETTLLAEIGSFSLEFIRLSMLTGDPKWYDAVQRITELLQKQQQSTRLPGMWPILVNAQKQDFRQHTDYTLGAMADSLFEYLPKTHALVGGLLPMYRHMYEASMDTAIRHNLFRPMLPDENDVLISGLVTIEPGEHGEDVPRLRPEAQHLVCFAGGMLALGGRLVNNETHVEKGEKLMDGCVWTYEAIPLGIMPETFHMLPCESADYCPWNETLWRRTVLTKVGLDADMDAKQAKQIIQHKRIPEGFVAIGDPRYVLRPEAIESVFILYRITGRRDLPNTAWRMFETIEENTKTPLASATLADVTVTEGKPPQIDSMESFWLGETLKYFYLMFSEPELISLDEYVFNTEAHPLKRLLPSNA